ncbi:MFS general substrate transporter [Atractiella rhizophila]|nr:MFS general substrate transporter [Atractiella rhizophila]
MRTASRSSLRLSQSSATLAAGNFLQEEPFSSEIKRLRRTMLLSASCLSIGSHFGSHILGPLHTQFGSDTMFSILLSSFQLLNTITSLGGFVVPKYGVGNAGLFCTGIIALGQGTVWANNRAENVWGMTLGLLIFGIGISPLAAVQESIIVKHFSAPAPDGGKPKVGLTVALALLAGKTSSFAAGALSSPLSTNFGHTAPFLVSFLLSAISFCACLVYVNAERKYERLTSGLIEEVGTRHRHSFGWKDLHEFGDAFWGYIGICWIFGGFMYPFLHLCPEILQTLYDTTSNQAGATASITLLSSVILYPLVGRWLDSRPFDLPIFFTVGSCLQLLSISILLNPSLRTLFGRWVSISGAALGIGYGPLLLVLACARVVDRKWVSVGLGIHKSLEMSGSTVIQSIMGRMLDTTSEGETDTSKQRVLAVLFLFFILNILHLCTIFLFNRTLHKRHLSLYTTLPKEPHEGEEDDPLLSDSEDEEEFGDEGVVAKLRNEQLRLETRRRGRFFSTFFALAVVGAWVAFILNVRAERAGTA